MKELNSGLNKNEIASKVNCTLLHKCGKMVSSFGGLSEKRK